MILSFFIGSCNQLTSINDNISFSLYGTWVRAESNENVTILNGSDELNEHEYGFIIYANGEFVERKNSGWCATPPISYANFNGKWKAISENLLEITVGYWGGTTSYLMEIVSLYNNQLKIIYHYDL